MGSFTAARIIDLAAIQLSDQVNLQWSRKEMLGWLDAGQREIGLLAPSALREVAVVPLKVGTRQEIPGDGFQLLDIYRNMGADGVTPGKVVRVTSRRLLDSYTPNWHTTKATVAVTNFLFDPQNNTAFWVYPPADGTGKLEILYATNPVPITDELTVITVDDIYASALVDYLLFRANSKQAEFANSAAATAYYAAFAQAVSGKQAGEDSNSPNAALVLAPPGSVKGAES